MIWHAVLESGERVSMGLQGSCASLAGRTALLPGRCSALMGTRGPRRLIFPLMLDQALLRSTPRAVSARCDAGIFHFVPLYNLIACSALPCACSGVCMHALVFEPDCLICMHVAIRWFHTVTSIEPDTCGNASSSVTHSSSAVISEIFLNTRVLLPSPPTKFSHNIFTVVHSKDRSR